MRQAKLSQSISDLLPVIRQSGERALEIYARPVKAGKKADKSPVTEADLAVDEILSSALREHFPGIPVVTEEQRESHLLDIENKPFFLVDPIDGTREFIKKTGEFTINVAYMEKRMPVWGIVYAPALGRLFAGQVGVGAFEFAEDGGSKSISVRKCDNASKTAVASRSHLTAETEDFLSSNSISDWVSAGSSLKFCTLACGEADIYPRFGPTMEWDTAAGHAVLSAAGGMVQTLDGKPLVYGKPEFRNPNFIACTPTVAFKNA